MPDFYELLKQFGVPGAFAMGLIWLIYRAGQWLAPRADRIVDAHIELVGSLKTTTIDINKELAAKDGYHRRTHAAINEATRLAEALARGTPNEAAMHGHCEAIRRALEIAE